MEEPSVEGCWLQIDPEAARIAVKGDVADARASVRRSPRPGRLMFRGDRIAWSMQSSRGRRKASAASASSLEIPHQRVVRWRYACYTATDGGTAAVLTLECGSAFTLYPFGEDDLRALLPYLRTVLQMPPTSAQAAVQIHVARRLASARNQALRALEQERDPLIDDERELSLILKNLLSETKPFSLHELERLFHSCRLNVKVAESAVAMLGDKYMQTITEHAEHRVLSVLERISEVTIMRPHSRALRMAEDWLGAAESSCAQVAQRASALSARLLRIRERRLTQLEVWRLQKSFSV